MSLSLYTWLIRIRDVAQMARARALGARGRWFESSRPDKQKHTVRCAFVCRGCWSETIGSVGAEHTLHKIHARQP